MKFIRIVPWVFIALSLQATAQTTEAPLTKEQRIKALRKALGSSGGSETPVSEKAKVPAAPIDYRDRALSELRPKEDSYSHNLQPILATVQTQKIEATDPVLYQGLQLGLTFQRYRPQGRVRLVTLGERSVDQQPTVMTGLEMRYMPFTTTLLGHHTWGFRGAVNYAVQNVKLYGPTGKDLGPTKLHSIQAAGYVSQEWSFADTSDWSWLVDIGIGHFDLIQTGEHNFSQASGGGWIALLRTGPSYRLGSVWMNLAYERRTTLTRDWARIKEDGVLLGVQYGFR
ncbi:MAG: hypothetical protein KF799_13535 [Bdellovibrionales bacterium]|nr:hypothetical protein [Bdellovibrionales bacterium]